MPAISLPSINISESDFQSKETMEQILDTLQKYRKELNFLLMNLDVDNMPEVGGLIGDIQGNYSLIQQDLDGIIMQVGNIQGDVSSLALTAEGLQTQVSNNTGQISTLTQTAEGLQTQVASLDSEVGGFYSEITQLSNEISSIVSFTDVTGNMIASRINQTATTITLEASKIDLNGITTVNKQLRLGTTYDNQGSIVFPGSASIEGTGEGISIDAMSNISLGSSYILLGGLIIDFNNAEIKNFSGAGGTLKWA